MGKTRLVGNPTAQSGKNQERIDHDVSTLSFGEGRLLELARALAGEPRVILLDEPAAGLTQPEMARLGAAIRDIAARGIAVLLIEHDMHFLFRLRTGSWCSISAARSRRERPKRLPVTRW
jgi:ABC-type branched-subunit amino acid transport system ATPase component